MKRDRRRGDEGPPREYRPEEVDALTVRANKLLDELHTVLDEMSQRLRVIAGDEGGE